MPEFVQTMKEFTPDKPFEDYHPKLENYNEALQSLDIDDYEMDDDVDGSMEALDNG